MQFIETVRLHLSRRRTWIVLAVALLAAIILAIAIWPEHASTEAVETPALTVTSASTAKVEWPDSLQTSGAIAPWQEAIVGAEISGQKLVEILVNVGDVVKKDQVLARHSTEMLQAERSELYAEWIQAEANRKRGVRLKQGGALSNQRIETYMAAAAIAKARLERKDLELRNATVVAPDDGLVSSRTATLGAVSNAGAELFRIILQNRLEWRGDLTAEQLARVAPGQTVELSLPGGSKTKAVVRQISPSLNSDSRMATAYADIEPGSAAHAGMYATGKIVISQTDAIIVPAVSVVIRDGRSYVFKLGAEQGITNVSRQEVTTGRNRGNEIEIVSGLAPGERVAAWGAGFLNDGDTVLVVAAPAGDS